LRRSKVRITEIAKAAGVATSTAYVALNRESGVPVAEETRAKVLAAAEELGYQQSVLSRAIKSPLRQVGFGVGDIHLVQNTFSSVIFQAANEHLYDHGYSAVVHRVAWYRSETEQDVVTVPGRVIDLHRSRLVDGMILDKQFFLDREIFPMQDAGVRVVCVNGGLQMDRHGTPTPTVTNDSELAARLAVEHLASLGHRRVALVSRPYAKGPHAFHSQLVKDFRDGFEAGCVTAGEALRTEWIVEGDMLDRVATFGAIDALFAPGTAGSGAVRPTALVVGDDQIAVMAIQRLRAIGLRVPEDVSIVGFGNLEVANRLGDLPLTTIDPMLTENGRAAARMLIEMIRGGAVAQPHDVIQPKLVVRESTAAAP